MTSKEIKEIQAKLEEKTVQIKINEAYAEGKNHFILKERDTKSRPDHRIPVPLAKMTIDDMTGYAGRAGDRTLKVVTLDEDREDDPFLEYKREMDEYNDEDIETSELFEETCTQGVSYEIWWASESGSSGKLKAEYKIVPNESVYIIWSDDIKPKMEGFIYFSGDDKERHANVYDDKTKTVWVSKDGGGYVPMGEEEAHPFNEPPLIVFPGNRKERPIFAAGKSLIDAYDIIMSRSMNEVERFNSLILIMAKAASPEFREALAESDIDVVDNEGDVERTDLPKYLQKDFSGINELYNNTLDRLSADYTRVVLGIDMSDEQFAGNQSGVAQAFKLLAIEYAASKIDMYFNKGMKKRLDFYAAVYNAGAETVNPDDYKAEVTSKRNIPVDVASVVTIATALLGLGISKEAILDYLPNQIIGDVQKEMERQEAEAAARRLGMGEINGEE